jgi:chemotaxis protein methyltransferase WspC
MDVSPLSVDKARRGCTANSFRGRSWPFASGISPPNGRPSPQRRVREQVRLQVGNVLDPALLAGEPPFDFVFCRNLLIYFDQPTQNRCSRCSSV